jgi:uncharacterized repeat protein (TIGR01451 family)
MNKRLSFLIIMAVMILIIPTVVSANENDTSVGDSNPKNSADLEITTDEKEITVDEIYDFDIMVTVKNKGPKTAENVKVQTSIPSDLTFYQALASEGSFNQKTGIWKIGNLKPNQKESLLITLDSKKIGKSSVDFNVKSSTKDANPSNNRLTVNVNAVDFLEYEDNGTLMNIWLTVSKISKKPGEEIKFNITVYNHGSKAAENVMVNSIMPKGWVIHFNPSKGSFNKKTGIWKIGKLNPDENASATISTKAGKYGDYFFYFKLKSDTKLALFSRKAVGVDVPIPKEGKENRTSLSGDKRLGEQRSLYSPSAYSDYRQVTSSSNHTVEAKMDEKPTGNPIMPALLSLTLIGIRFKKNRKD